MSEIRTMVRQILLEELAKHKDFSNIGSQNEAVSIRNDKDLNAFALRVLDMAKKRDLKADIQSGKVKFFLTGNEKTKANADTARQSSNPDPVCFNKGLVTEKDISRLASTVCNIRAGKHVCFTPLATDEIRRKGLKIEWIS
jgi:hypothetical protein